MPISNTNPSNNTGVDDVIIYQDWMAPPRQINLVKSLNVPVDIPTITVDIPVKDVIGLYPASAEFRLRITKTYLPDNVVPWIAPFNYELNGVSEVNGIIPITQNGNILQYPVTTVSLPLLPVGLHRFRQLFEIQRKMIFGLWQTISSITHETILNVNNDLVLFSPKNNLVDHIMGTSLKNVAVTFSGPEWQLVGSFKFLLSSSAPNVTIVTVNSPEGDYQLASGTGTAVVNITLTNYFDIPGQEPYTRTYDPLAVKVNGVVVDVVAMRVLKFSTPVLSLSPAQLFFEAEKNLIEAEPQNLFFECNVLYNITCSSWLSFYESIISVDGAPFKVIVVTPIASSNLEAGIYQGFVKVTATINGELEEVVTNVTYTINDMAVLPILANQVGFTLDNEFIQFTSFNQDTYMQMSLKIKSFDFFTDAENDFELREKVGLFKGRAKVNIGKVIHQIMRKLKPINENVFQYKPTVVNIQIFENTLDNDETIRTRSFGNIQYLAGLSNNFNKIGFLKFNHQPERVTVNSFKYLNFYIPAGNDFKLRVFKNNQVIDDSFIINSENKVMSFKYLFAQFQQGDKIDFQLLQDTSGDQRALVSSKISYIVFPEGKFSNHIIWEDEFLLKQTLECTGNFSIKTNLSFISQNLYVDLVEQLSHLDIEKVSKISINTGWLLQSDVDAIESLMKSKKVWINSNQKTIFMVPISENITNQDSARELVDYSIEFQINPNYNEETFSL